MKLEVEINNVRRMVELERKGDTWRMSLDGERMDADAVAIAPNVYSILLHGKSYEIRVAPTATGALTLQTGRHEFTAQVMDARAWRGRHHGALQAEGRQQVLAPMPGKIVRLLVQAGEKVKAGQGLMVVEAMKMQNEIRSPKSGSVERVLVKEGQPVNAGEVLAWID